MFPGRRSLRYQVVAIISFVLSTPLAAVEQLYFEKRDISALTIPSVNDICQDRTGYIWLATPGGIVRYDGGSMILIDRTGFPELGSDRINAIEFVASRDEIWVGTASGLSVHSPGKGVIRPLNLRNGNGRHGNGEIGVILDTPGEGVFLIADGDVYHARNGEDPGKIDVDPAVNDSVSTILDLAAGSDGSVWAVSDDGLKRWDTDAGRFIHVYTASDLRCLEVVDTEIWVGGNSGAFRYLPSGHSESDLEIDGEVSAISLGPDETVWIASSSGLTIIGVEQSGRTVCVPDQDHPYSLPSGRITSLFSGFDGHMWIGTADYGLLSVDPNKANHLAYHRKSGYGGLPYGLIQVIRGDSLGYIWAGSDIGGLARIDPEIPAIWTYGRQDDELFALPGDRISSIIEDDTGRIWIGTDRGPVFYVPEIDGFEPAGGMMSGWPDFNGRAVEAMTEGKDGAVWVAFRDGEIFRLDSREWSWWFFQFPPGTVTTVLLTDHKGQVWAGSRSGLHLFSPSGALIRFWPVETHDSLPAGGVTALYEDSQDSIWIGGPGGLSVIRTPGTVIEPIRFTRTPPSVTGISEDSQGGIWIGDGRSVHILNSAGEALRTIGSADGLTPSGMIRSVSRDGQGRILLGANGEIWAYDAPPAAPAITPPRVILTELRILDEILPIGSIPDSGEAVRLLPTENIISIGYAAIDFRFQRDIRFRYQLSGYHRDWLEAGKTDTVTYAGLPPGRYSFSVTAFNEFGMISGESIVLPIQVVPPFWRTVPALVLYVLALFVIAGLVLKFWESRLLKTQIRELEDARRKLAYLTMNDGLTGLLNRRGFDQGMEHAFATAKRNGLPITLMMLDVDFFKLYNDHYGHVQGDEVLRAVGRTLRNVFERSTDIIARYGGEEFAVSFIGDDPSSAVMLANGLAAGISELNLMHEYSTVSGRLTLSVGSATIRLSEDDTVDNLIRRADKALYAAKTGGRDRVCFTGIIPNLPEVMNNGREPLVIDFVDER